MPAQEWLREHLRPILREHTDRYWLCYQVLKELQVRAPEVLADLERRYPGQGYGVDGGAHYRPDNAISQCLAGWPECVDTRHLHGKGLRIGEITGSAQRFGIFRWVGLGS